MDKGVQLRLWGGLVSLAVVTAMLWPVSWDPYVDSYPLSSFPMFTQHREREILVHFVRGLDPKGEPVTLSPRWLGTEEVMQAASSVRIALETAPEGTRRLCDQVAQRLRDDGDDMNVVEVQVVSGRYDAILYFEDEAASLLHVHVHAACPVETPAQGPR